MTTGEPHCPTPGSVIPLASTSATVDRTTSRMAGDSRLGGNEIGGVLPVSKRAFSTLVADIGLVPSLNRSRNSCSKSRNSASSSGVKQLLGEGKPGMKVPFSVICYAFTLSAAGAGVLSGSGNTGLGRGGRVSLSGVRARSAEFVSLIRGASPDNSPVEARSGPGSPLRPRPGSPTPFGPGGLSMGVREL